MKLFGYDELAKKFSMERLHEMCIRDSVSTGQPIWEYEIKQPGTVLYLALEDNYQRLQERMARMFGVESAGELFFAVSAKQVGNGLDEQLAFFLREMCIRDR